MTVFEGRFTDAGGLRIAVVVARFNDLVTGKLLSGCLDCLSRHGIDVAETSTQLDWPGCLAVLKSPYWPSAWPVQVATTW